MLDRLTQATFEPLCDADFALHVEGEETLPLRLVDVRPLGTFPNAPRQDPFGLVFAGPPAPVLGQRIYRIAHPALGELELFLVPIGFGPDGGVRYEAVFN